MELSVKFLVLLASGFQLAYCQINCGSNLFKNQPRLITSMSGWLWTINSNNVYSNNEVFNCDLSFNRGNVFCRTTNDAGCCKSFNISTTTVQGTAGGSYFPYLIKTDADCPEQLEENAHMKFLEGFTDRDDTYCFVLWTCRPSRQVFHAFCSKPKVTSIEMKSWIFGQFAKFGQVKRTIKQDKDYRCTGCFPNATTNDDYFQ